jgi:hypothetical protein
MLSAIERHTQVTQPGISFAGINIVGYRLEKKYGRRK